MMFRLARHFNPHVLAAAALAVPCTALMQGAEKPETKVYEYSAADIEKLASTPPAPALDPAKFQSFRLVRRERISHDSSRLTFALPRENDELGLSVASLLVVQGPNLDNGASAAGAGGKMWWRPVGGFLGKGGLSAMRFAALRNNRRPTRRPPVHADVPRARPWPV